MPKRGNPHQSEMGELTGRSGERVIAVDMEDMVQAMNVVRGEASSVAGSRTKSPPMGPKTSAKTSEDIERSSHREDDGIEPGDQEEDPFLAVNETHASSFNSRSGPLSKFWHVLNIIVRHGLTRQLLLLSVLFFVIWVSIFVFFLPVMDPKDRERLKIPASLAEVREMYEMLGEYKAKHYWAVLLGFSSAYLVKMALALPGSPLFNLLGGALFGVPVGFPVCLLCTSVGTALCYLFFNTFGGPLVRRVFVEQLARLDEGVRHHRRRLFYYLTVIRIFPMTPNFFINLAAPLLRLPLVPHLAAATCGLAPITFLTCQAGMTLSTLQNVKDAVDKRVLLSLGGIAIAATIPLLLRRRVEESLETLTDTTPVVLPEELRADATDHYSEQ